jgi:hypothetical protein
MEFEVMVAGIEPKITKFEYVEGSWVATCNGYDFDVF